MMDTIDEHAALVSSPRRQGKNGSKKNPYEQIDKRGFVGRKDFRKKKPKVQRLGSKSKRSWGFKLPKIRIRIVSPLRLLAKLRDAYVNMMMNFASKGCAVGMALGPVSGRIKHPGRNIEPSLKAFSDAELMYIEYLKRDTAFMRSILSN
ncbi:unnamed protein product [Calypogeia fissa]